MFIDSPYWKVEPICYDNNHISKNLEIIARTFSQYFEKFIDTEAGNASTKEEFDELRNKFAIFDLLDKHPQKPEAKFKRLIAESIDDFEKDRSSYLDLFDREILEEMEEDVETFKSEILRNQCPVIRKTLRSADLGKYKHDFSVADPSELLKVVTNLCEFADDYEKNTYNPKTYDCISNYKELGMGALDTDDYTVEGVIGGGIKTMMLYKAKPAVFPNRSQNALWALWYLSDKKTYDCKYDSEFLMIDNRKYITQQNYFYPYELFAYYAFEIYKLLNFKAKEYNVHIDSDYRYVLVDTFLNYVAIEHDDEIKLLKEKIGEDGSRSYV